MSQLCWRYSAVRKINKIIEFLCTVACYANPGQFIHIDAAASNSGSTAVLEMPGLTIDQDYCLEFYYHMHGSDIGELMVEAGGLSAFTVAGSRSRQNMVAFLPLQGCKHIKW